MNNISICIPTYNRAPYLKQCLEHLAAFRDSSFEVLVGNNASMDDTDKVVGDLSSQFSNFVYLRHVENIGFARNMDALLRRASRQFVYILNDDDFVFESALTLAASLMRANSTMVAVVGKYLSLRSLNSSLQIHYADAVATTIKKGAFSALLENLSLCDGHPIIRRDVFERCCSYLDRTGTLIPLYFSLLQHGDVVAVDKPFFQHRTTGESLTGRMADAWFLDMANVDIELAISQSMPSLPAGVLSGVRQKLLQLLYFQAARMSLNRKAPYLLWLFLRRLIAVEGAAADVLLKCEYHFSHDFLVDRVSTILNDAAFSVVHFVAGDATSVLVAQLAAVTTDIQFKEVNGGTEIGNHDILLVGSSAELSAMAFQSNHSIVLDALFEQVRLTSRPCQLTAEGGRIGVRYTDKDALESLSESSHGFNAICAPYSEAL